MEEFSIINALVFNFSLSYSSNQKMLSVIVCLVCVSICFVEVVPLPDRKFSKMTDVKLGSTYIELRTSSHARCVYQCGRESACKAAQYNEGDGHCTLSKNYPISATSTHHLWTFYAESVLSNDCYGIQQHTENTSPSGVYTIQLPVSKKLIQVYCDMDTDGGGWTVLQKRYDGSTDFYLGIGEYENGFGQLSNELWLGLSNLYELTSGINSDLRIDVEAKNGDTAFEKYSAFSVSQAPNYRLNYGEITDTSGGISISQWVSSVSSFSSEWGGQWSASQVIGQPNIYPNHGDLPGSWCPGTYTTNEYIEVQFATASYVREIDIYETLHGGRVFSVQALYSSTGKWDTLFSTSNLMVLTSARKFSPSLKITNFETQTIRISIDCYNLGGKYCEIDAIMLHGYVPSLLRNNGAKFATKDKDSILNCAQLNHGAWWYDNCAGANLNGHYVTPGTESTYNSGMGGVIGSYWFKGKESLKETKMMFRRT